VPVAFSLGAPCRVEGHARADSKATAISYRHGVMRSHLRHSSCGCSPMVELDNSTISQMVELISHKIALAEARALLHPLKLWRP